MCRSPGETLLREIRQKKTENDYMILPENIDKNLEQKRGPWSFPFPPPPPPPPQKKKKKKKKKIQIWILCQNSLTRELKIRVVGFVHKKLLTYFEMLIVPHALQCVDGCFLAHLSHRLMVSYCHQPMSGVRRPSSVVRRASSVVNNCFKRHLL